MCIRDSSYSPYGIADSQSQLLVACDYLERWSSSIALQDVYKRQRMYASAGVLSIETEKPHFENERNSAFRVQMRGGSFGYVSPSIRWWQPFTEVVPGKLLRIPMYGN